MNCHDNQYSVWQKKHLHPQPHQSLKASVCLRTLIFIYLNQESITGCTKNWVHILCKAMNIQELILQFGRLMQKKFPFSETSIIGRTGNMCCMPAGMNQESGKVFFRRLGMEKHINTRYIPIPGNIL